MANQKQSIHDKMGGVAVLLIDPQVDFHPGGSLAIETANDDSDRLAKLIKENEAKITQITVTLDTHQRLHIANPLFWQARTIRYQRARIACSRAHHGLSRAAPASCRARTPTAPV